MAVPSILRVQELDRRPSPQELPHALAYARGYLWIGTRDTKELYRIKLDDWSADLIDACPGTPWGMTAADDALYVTCGETQDDTRRIRRFRPGIGWDATWTDCPGDEGSYLAFDGMSVYLVQWHRHRILPLDEHLRPAGEISLPHGCVGAAFVGRRLFLVTTDDEEGKETSPHWLSYIDVDADAPVCRDLYSFGYAARSLAFDGSTLWTNHRKANSLVRLAVPQENAWSQ